MNLAPLMSSKRMDWCTPEWLIQEIAVFFGGIDLDPCASREQSTGAGEEWFTDGFDADWEGCIYVNPPYGREIGKWIDRCREVGGNGEVIALVPARTDTKWWHEAYPYAVCFLRGRLTFVGAEHPAPCPSALRYWGNRSRKFCARFAKLGIAVEY